MDDRIGYKLFHSFWYKIFIKKKCVCMFIIIWEKIFWLCHSYLRFNIDHIARLSFYDYNLLFIVGYISYFFYLWNFDFYKYLWAWVQFIFDDFFFIYWIDHIDYSYESLNYGSSFWFLFYRFWYKIFERRNITFVANGLIFFVSLFIRFITFLMRSSFFFLNCSFFESFVDKCEKKRAQ